MLALILRGGPFSRLGGAGGRGWSLNTPTSQYPAESWRLMLCTLRGFLYAARSALASCPGSSPLCLFPRGPSGSAGGPPCNHSLQALRLTSPRDHCHPFPGVQCPESPHFLYLVGLLAVPGRRVLPACIMPPRAVRANSSEGTEFEEMN